MRAAIRFLRRGRVIELDDVSPAAIVLDHLRLKERACGTKEGCAEGDCGACTVAVGTLLDGRLRYEPVNSCIHLAGAGRRQGGRHRRRPRRADGSLHPVQSAMVEYHGSQCGFCTPGIVMTLFSLYHDAARPDPRRCQRLAGRQSLPLHRLSSDRRCRARSLHAIRPTLCRPRAPAPPLRSATLAPSEDIFIGDDAPLPRDPARPSKASPHSTPGTPMPCSSPVQPMSASGSPNSCAICPRSSVCIAPDSTSSRTTAGRSDASVGGVTYGSAEAHSRRLDPDMGELLRRLGSKQVRAAGTIGGNIANGSPIGDTPPALIALGATIELRRETDPHPAARRFLHRLWQAGPGAGRVPDPHQSSRGSAAARFPLLQNFQALRPGHLRRHGRVPLRA